MRNTLTDGKAATLYLARAFQLVGLALLGIGVALRFTNPARRRPWRILAFLGATTALLGAILSPNWRALWQVQNPDVYVGLLTGVAAPFLLVLALTFGWRWVQSRKRRP